MAISNAAEITAYDPQASQDRQMPHIARVILPEQQSPTHVVLSDDELEVAVSTATSLFIFSTADIVDTQV